MNEPYNEYVPAPDKKLFKTALQLVKYTGLCHHLTYVNASIRINTLVLTNAELI